jgi:putative membrane protein
MRWRDRRKPMAMPSDAAQAAAAPERRLHPWSWLFVLLAQLKQFFLPLVAVFFFGGDRNELWPMLGVGVLALNALLQYFTYRYRIGREALTIRSGWLQRSRREIPFARIHNVVVRQSLLHRLFGVAELQLESAGGHKPEAQMRVLRLGEALALERLLRRRGAPAAPAASPATPLLQLSPGELVRLGLVSNRGPLVIGAAVAVLMQLDARLLADLVARWSEALLGWAAANGAQPLALAVAGASLALAALALLALFSIALAFVQYHGFTLGEEGRRLTVERGLLARLRASTPRRRIQAWTLSEGVLQRWFRRRSLQVDSAGGNGEGDQPARGVRELAPIATPAQCDALIEHLLPGAGWSALEWRPLHPRAWRRLAVPGLLFGVVATAALTWRFGAAGLGALLWLPWALFAARRHARHAGYACNGRLVAVRGGWLQRHWRFAAIGKLQALRLAQSPFDRRHGMATLWLDTAGASRLVPPLRIRYLDQAVARALYRELAATLARRSHAPS